MFQRLPEPSKAARAPPVNNSPGAGKERREEAREGREFPVFQRGREIRGSSWFWGAISALPGRIWGAGKGGSFSHVLPLRGIPGGILLQEIPAGIPEFLLRSPDSCWDSCWNPQIPSRTPRSLPGFLQGFVGTGFLEDSQSLTGGSGLERLRPKAWEGLGWDRGCRERN